MIYNINISNKAIIDNEVNISLQQAYLLDGLHAIVSDWDSVAQYTKDAKLLQNFLDILS